MVTTKKHAANQGLSLTKRGTPVWGFKHFKENGLVNLMLDLLQKAHTGLDDQQCQTVSDSLEEISIQLSKIPDHFWIRKSIMGSFDQFKAAYFKWNEIKGNDSKAAKARQKALQRMRKNRHKMARVVRTNVKILNDALDLELIENIYGALGNIPRALPELFINLSKAVTRFQKKAKK
ncbi:MAG TPA: hypothetical protein ENN22_08750 [bacterium]|nr:hypothetical protein [bacterium]